MPICEHITEFMGKPVEDWEPERGVTRADDRAYRLGVSYDEAEEGARWPEKLQAFLDDPKARDVTALVVGPWGDMADDGACWEVVTALAAARDRLPNLRGIFFGDIVCEESEISWIVLCNARPLLDAYPLLEAFTVRGGDVNIRSVAPPKPPPPPPPKKPGLLARFFGGGTPEPPPPPPPPPPPAPPDPGPLRNSALRSLVIQTGGLNAQVIRDVTEADLPALEHLELWLGEENYGGDVKVEDLEPILSGRLFPRLQYLGLKDSEIADEIAQAVAVAPVLERIRVLDLSMGTLGDEGAEALLAGPAVARLEKLDVHHHYLSPEVEGRLKALGIEVDTRERQEADEDGGREWRYIAVGE